MNYEKRNKNSQLNYIFKNRSLEFFCQVEYGTEAKNPEKVEPLSEVIEAMIFGS